MAKMSLEKNEIEVVIPVEFKELFNTYWRVLLYYGGRGSTKSHSVARSLLLRGRKETKRILCGRELQNSIEDSSYQLLVDLIRLYKFDDYVVTKTSIINKITHSNFIFKGLKKGTTQSVKSLEGIDIAWIEEAQSISQESLDILSPTVRKDGSQLIFTFNRQTEQDPVYQKYIATEEPMERVFHKMVNYDVAIRMGVFPEVLRLEMEYDKANDPEMYAHKWLGQPVSQSDEAILSRTAVLGAMERDIEAVGAIEVGADIARMGNDRTEFVKRKGLKEIARKTYKHLRTTEVCDKLEDFVDQDKTILLKIDDTGVGGGVTDEMIKRGYNVLAVNFGAKPKDKDKYPNLISEAWFYMREIVDEIDLLNDSDLLMELSTREWVMDSKGRRGVESKDSYKKRGNRSPDKADATILCFYTPRIKQVRTFAEKPSIF